MSPSLQPAVLALIDGAAHFLPISAGGHRLLMPWMLQWRGPGAAFDAAVLLGAALALLIHMRGRWMRLCSGREPRLFWGLSLASLPGVLAGVLLRGRLASFDQPDRVALALIGFGILLWAADRRGRKERDVSRLGWWEFLAVGLAQACAVLPGVSSVGATMTACLFLGLRRPEALSFSFLLLLTLLPGAAVMRLKDLSWAALGTPFWVGLAVSGIAAYGALRFMERYLEKRDLSVFVLYRVGLGLLALLLSTAQPPVKSARELKLSPPTRPAEATLSPRALRLKRHVSALAVGIGERSLVRRDQKELNKGRDYVAAQFKDCGLKPVIEPYHSQWMGAVRNGTTFYNVVVELPGTQTGQGVLVVGAHYDTAPNTPGADDNASGVAVLLELACALKGKPAPQPLRFVAYSTEEPPAFGTKNMGSAYDARQLKARGVKVAGMISLEMLGYYDTRPGSQIFFPFLKWITPEQGDFLALVSNWPSRHLLKRVKKAWRAASDFPLVAVALPEMDAIRPSDHQGYWDAGFPALLLTDTSSYRTPHYHEMSDLPETLDYAAMDKVTGALLGVLSAGEPR